MRHCATVPGIRSALSMSHQLLGTLACAALCACATDQAPIARPLEAVFHDELFDPSAASVATGDPFALSAEMKRFVHVEIKQQLRDQGPALGLVSALYRRRQVALEYDASMTRNAIEAFDARKGNCLSLVIMAAAFAKELGLQVTYQSVAIEELWSRVGDIAFLNGHVNLVLGQPAIDATPGYDAARRVTVDFVPGEDIARLHTRAVSENTIVAMYQNNRAAEALARRQVDQAYWWARAAILRAPEWPSAYNTLAVLYLEHGNLQESAQVLERLLQHDPRDRPALANLASVDERLGHDEQAAALRTRLAQLEPYPPYHFFQLGVAAMRRGDYQAARSLFAWEVDHAGYDSEFHFWLALACVGLGERAEANRQLQIAQRDSLSNAERNLYEAKLLRLREVELR